MYPTSSTKTHTSDFCSCLFPSGQDLVLQFSTAVGVGGNKSVYTLTPSISFTILAGRGANVQDTSVGAFGVGGVEERCLQFL